MQGKRIHGEKERRWEGGVVDKTHCEGDAASEADKRAPPLYIKCYFIAKLKTIRETLS